jgi:hypothetical protein
MITYRKGLFLLAVFYVFVTACASDTSSSSLTKKDVERVSAELKAGWINTTKSRLAYVYNSKEAKEDGITMPLWWIVYGEKPADGYCLYISLHGGGGAPAEVNDQQWENQKRLYHPKNCVYVAPRAPWNEWNMWFKQGIDPLYEDIIQMAVAYFGVNPDKVYIMGYSAGGDGVWRVAPRMADTWAAASMMAGHPGDVSLINLRNTPFMIWCGELDSAYNRNVLDAQRGVEMDSLQRADPEGYIHKTTIAKGMAHWMNRIDTVAVDWMAQYRRNPYPKKIVWQQEEVLRQHFYWLEAPENELKRGMTVRAEIQGNEINLTRCDYSSLTICLNDDLVNLDLPVTVKYDGRTLFSGIVERTKDNMVRTLANRNDLSYMFPSIIKVKLK